MEQSSNYDQYPFLRRFQQKHLTHFADSDGPLDEPGDFLDADQQFRPNISISKVAEFSHRLMLDIDVPCFQVPSSTEGHSHLYFPQSSMQLGELVAIQQMLASVGIVNQGYVDHTIRRGFASLRLPWVKK